MIIVYRKSDKEILFNSGKSFVEPSGMSDENGKLAVIEQIGGTFDDYGIYRLHDIDDEENVNEILQYQDYVSLIFDDEKVIGYEVDYEQYEIDKQERLDQELLDSLIPSKDEMLMAEIENNIINLLMEVELI